VGLVFFGMLALAGCSCADWLAVETAGWTAGLVVWALGVRACAAALENEDGLSFQAAAANRRHDAAIRTRIDEWRKAPPVNLDCDPSVG
jgi:hypothetical protein